MASELIFLGNNKNFMSISFLNFISPKLPLISLQTICSEAP